MRAPSQSDHLIDHNIESVIRVDMQHLDKMTHAERFADRLTDFASSWIFISLQVILIAGWIIYNQGARAFDPSPFNLLNLVITVEALLLAVFVLATQRRMRQGAWRREHLGLQIGLLTEQEVTAVLSLLQRVAKRLDVDEVHPDASKLAEQTDLQRVVDKIDDRLPQ